MAPSRQPRLVWLTYHSWYIFHPVFPFPFPSVVKGSVPRWLTHYDIFHQQLAVTFPAYGHALWGPRPGEFYPTVEVGDVGFIREGKFHRHFNTYCPQIIHLIKDSAFQNTMSHCESTFHRTLTQAYSALITSTRRMLKWGQLGVEYFRGD